MNEPTERAELEVVPPDAAAAWDALPSEERARIETTASAVDVEAWKKLWIDLLFLAPAAGLPAAQWRQKLQQIRHAFEERFPGLSSESERIASPKKPKRRRARKTRGRRTR